MKEVFRFLKELRAHNDREWFNAHKDEYLAAKKKTDNLTEELIAGLSVIDPDAARLSVANCTYRIYRDTRFSADKTPYKTHIGIFINPPEGKKSLRSGYYVHIEPGASLVCGGNIGLPGPLIKAIRRSIADETEEYLEILNSVEFKSMIQHVGQDPVKTAPAGFSKDWEHIDLVRPRNFTAWTDLPDSFFFGRDVAGRLTEYFAVLKRYNDFINYTIDEWRASAQGRQILSR